MTDNIVSFKGKVKPCPKCGDSLYYVPRVKGWSHIYTIFDMEEKFCHYNERQDKEVSE